MAKLNMWECKGLIKVTLNDDVFIISIHSRTENFDDRFKPSVTIVMICTSNNLTFLVNKLHSFNPRETAYVTFLLSVDIKNNYTGC